MINKYEFREYDKIFPELFEQEKARISSYLTKALAIEHVGSTAVPNLGGKGIIDIAIAVEKNHMNLTLKELEDLGYEYRPTFSTEDRFYFVIYLKNGENRRYHIHLTYPENREWAEFLAFRDYLRNNEGALKEYADLKKRASKEADNDGVIYRKIKEPIFNKIR